MSRSRPAAMVKGATAGNLLAEAIKSALTWVKDFTVGSVMMAAENAKAEASLKALANAHGVGAAAAAMQVSAIEEIGFEYTEAAHAVQRLHERHPLGVGQRAVRPERAQARLDPGQP